MDKVNKQELRRLAEYVDQFRKGDKPDVEKFCQYTELFSAKGILSLLDELEQYRKDALRYRWLCNGNGYFMEEEMLCHMSNDKEEADAAIDAAMDEEGGANG